MAHVTHAVRLSKQSVFSWVLKEIATKYINSNLQMKYALFDRRNALESSISYTIYITSDVSVLNLNTTAALAQQGFCLIEIIPALVCTTSIQ